MDFTKTITIDKIIKQSNQLVGIQAILLQKIKIVNIILYVGVAYSVYAIIYSISNINKLDKQIISTTKAICGLPNYMMGFIFVIIFNLILHWGYTIIKGNETN